MRRRNNDFQLAGTKRQCGNLKQFFRCQDPPQPEGSHTSRRVPTPPPKYSISKAKLTFCLSNMVGQQALEDNRCACLIKEDCSFLYKSVMS